MHRQLSDSSEVLDLNGAKGAPKQHPSQIRHRSISKLRENGWRQANIQNPRGRWQLDDSSAVLDWSARRRTAAIVRSTDMLAQHIDS